MGMGKREVVAPRQKPRRRNRIPSGSSLRFDSYVVISICNLGFRAFVGAGFQRERVEGNTNGTGHILLVHTNDYSSTTN
jgi:hypothetical protein